MSAVSKSVTPASSAASTTARVPSASTRMPKLLQPRPTTDTSGPSVPNRRVRIREDARASRVRYRRLGSSDLEVSEISLGSWLTYGGGVGREQAEACVAKAFEVGITFIDTANVYSRGAAESLLGEVLSGRQRGSYILGTKLYFPMNGDRGLSREQVFKQIDLSLLRLRTDYVDLYQCHRYDFTTALEDTMAALALAWVLRRPEVAAAITGASRPEQVEENAAASGIELDDETLRAIDEAVGSVAAV